MSPHTFQKFSDLKIFPECFRGPHVARGLLNAHPWSRSSSKFVCL